MSDESIFDRLKARGEQMFAEMSGELMKNPQFVKAVQTAYQGKEKLDAAAARALKSMNIPTRDEFKKALRRIEALEAELAALQAAEKKKAAPARSRGKAR
jgi:polyhydroxyalkanoate synthesis regulator phasin